jgi:hypothetical protein
MVGRSLQLRKAYSMQGGDFKHKERKPWYAFGTQKGFTPDEPYKKQWTLEEAMGLTRMDWISKG